MAKKEPNDEPVDKQQQEIEERVRRMLDPNEPDEEPDKPSLEIVKDDDKEPGTAPEVKGETPEKLPESIQIKTGKKTDEEKGKKQKPEAEDKDTEKPASEEKESNKPAAVAINVKDESTGEAKLETRLGKTALEVRSEEVTEDEGPEDEAVDDIIAEESDELLAAEDEKIAEAFDNKKPGFGQKLKNFFAAWRQNKLARRSTVVIVSVSLVVAFVVPASRYFLLNTLGVRSSASVVVMDESTGQPLRNVQVSIKQQAVLTDDSGRAVLYGLKLGSASLAVEKRAFAVTQETVTIGWGSNPLGDRRLRPVGSQYSFVVTDFLSKKPIQKVEAVSGYASAFSDEKGRIKLTLDDVENEFEVILNGTNLRQEKLTLSAEDTEDHSIEMAPARKHVFISKRSGEYDVYKVDADGKNEELVLKGTGNEREDLVLLSHPTSEIASLVSTRDNVRNLDGYLLSTLTVINLADNSIIKVAQSERIRLVDWVGDRLIFVRIASGSSAANPKRHRLMSFNYQTGESQELATSNYFNDVVVAKESIYYAPSSAYVSGDVALYKPNIDGSNHQAILEKEVWNIFRSSYDKLTLATTKEWYEYSLDSFQVNQLSGEPSGLESKVYVDNPEKSKSLWVDERDGKGVLIIYDIETKTDGEVPLHAQSGLSAPVRWLNNKSVVFRIVTDQETADYVVSLDGGKPVKIRDVTNASSIESWYYY